MDETNIGLPLVNWPKPPPLRLNQLYWPCTGASRWAEGVFLCNGQAKNDIMSCQVADSGATLVYATDYDPQPDQLSGKPYRTAEWTMWPIAYRRIGGCENYGGLDPDGLFTTTSTDSFDLYLIHLVDERYWWQFVDTPDICKHLSSWLELINYLTGELGLGEDIPWTLPDDGVPTYSTLPHQSEWMRINYNAAQLLDAALASIGCRLVARTALPGNAAFEISRGVGAETIFLENKEKLTGEQLAGTDCEDAWTRAMPNYVTVAFPKSRFGMLCGQCSREGSSSSAGEDDCHEDYYTIETDISQFSDGIDTSINCPVTSATKTIHVRGWADMGVCADESPMNITELASLAYQIASDWFYYHIRQYDITVVGPAFWKPCGYDDCIIHKFGIEEDEDVRAYAHTESKQEGQTDTIVVINQERRRDCTSRIQSLPLNVGVDCQLHDTRALELPGHVFALTPADGIPAVNCGIYTGVLCDAYRLVGNLACGTLTREAITAIDADHEGDQYHVMVYNPSTQKVEEDRYVFTAPMQCCARIVVVEPCIKEECVS